MIEDIQAIPAAFLRDAGAVAMLALGVFFIFTGRLRSQRSIDETVSLQSERVADQRAVAESWRQAWIASEEARREQHSTLIELLELARTTDAILESLNANGGGGGGNGHG